MQRHRNVAAQSTGALDNGTKRHARAFGNSEEAAYERRAEREAGREIDFLRLHIDARGDDGSGGRFQREIRD